MGRGGLIRGSGFPLVMIKVPSPDLTGNEKPPMQVPHAPSIAVTSTDVNAAGFVRES